MQYSGTEGGEEREREQREGQQDGEQEQDKEQEQEQDRGEEREREEQRAGEQDKEQEPEQDWKGPRRVELAEVEPWTEPVDLRVVLDRIVGELKRVLVFPKWVVETLALWIVHTYAYRLRDLAIYLAIESPEKECGKSTLLMVLAKFVNRPALSSNISSSAFYHAIHELEPTLLIDEGDTNLRTRRELRAIFNGGYTKDTAYVWRMAFEKGGGGGNGKKSSRGTLVSYLVWSPKAIATIGHLEEILASRCIVVGMQRKVEGQECERLKVIQGEELKRQCARFVLDHGKEIAEGQPAIPRGLTNRAADVWEPLLVLADLAGGPWPELARQAAEGLTAQSKRHSPIGSLLMDIMGMFLLSGQDRLFTREIIMMLNESGERPWWELRRGKLASEAWLARQLRPYDIAPRTIRIGEVVGKGYLEADFEDAFRRYVPRSEVEAFKADLAARTKKAEGGEAGPGNGAASGQGTGGNGASGAGVSV